MIKVAELEGTELDYWVAQSEGIGTIRCEPNKYPHALRYASNISENYAPSTDWKLGGVIIERERIHLDFNYETEQWEATRYSYFDLGGYHTVDDRASGKTALIAAMRCYVASKFGAEIATQGE